MTNPLFLALAIILFTGALRDYKTAEELFAIEAPLEEELIILHWKEEFKERPFFAAVRVKDILIEQVENAAYYARSL